MYPDITTDEHLLFNEPFFQNAEQEITLSGVQINFPQLSIKEIAVIYNYTKVGYKPLNSSIRGNKTDNFIQANIPYLNFALNKLNKFKGTVFRGTQLPLSVINEYIEALDNQSLITQKFYLSTSSDINTAIAFAERIWNGVKTIFFIESITGIEIHEISAWGPYFRNITEHEVIFLIGTKFMVREVQNQPIDGDIYLIIALVEII